MNRQVKFQWLSLVASMLPVAVALPSIAGLGRHTVHAASASIMAAGGRHGPINIEHCAK